MILGILQARVTSSRLPGKVLKPILGEPMIQRQIERLSAVRGMDRLVVATSDHESDLSLVKLCREIDVDYFCGNLNDVLDRFYRCAEQYKPSAVVRLTGDCPLIDPAVVDKGIAFFKDNDFDYVSNSLTRTYPDGLDMEIFRYPVLEAAWNQATLPSEREHVTPFIYKHPEQFSVGQFINDVDYSALRWTVDEPADFTLVTTVFESLYPRKAMFGMEEILALFRARPELLDLNNQFAPNEGYEKSLAEDARYLARKERKS